MPKQFEPRARCVFFIGEILYGRRNECAHISYSTMHMPCAKNHDIERRRAVVKLPRAREKEREEDTVYSVVHIIFSRDVISEIHTRDTQVSYVTHIVSLRKKMWSMRVTHAHNNQSTINTITQVQYRGL